MLSYRLFRDASYLICCTMNNHLSEDIAFDDQTIESSKSAMILLKQTKIYVDTLPTHCEQLLTLIRSQLPAYIIGRTVTSVSRQVHTI
jgi:hypothetical protein